MKVPLLNFAGGPGVPLLNFRAVPGATFELWGGFRVPGPGPTFTSCHGNLAFDLLVQAQSLDEKINMKLLISFPLTPEPLRIGTSDGILLKTDNAKGMGYLLKNQLSPEKPDDNFTLVIEDGNSLFYTLKDIPRNFKEICLNYLEWCLQKLVTWFSALTCIILIVSSPWKDAGEETQINLLLEDLTQRN